MDYEKEIEKKYGVNNERYIHIMGVRKLAIELAKKRNVDEKKAEIAALLHDYYRYESDDFLLNHMDKDDAIKYYDKKYMYHGLASAYAAKTIFNVLDSDILNAIKYHTSGRLNMSPLEEIIFVADYAEENRKYPSCIEVRELLKNNYYKAIYMCISLIIDHLTSKKVKIENELGAMKEYYYKRYKESEE